MKKKGELVVCGTSFPCWSKTNPGALSRVAGLFSARGYNIESLTVAPTEDQTLSRMTMVTTGSEQIIEQITKQLNKLVDVVKLQDMTEGNTSNAK